MGRGGAGRRKRAEGGGGGGGRQRACGENMVANCQRDHASGVCLSPPCHPHPERTPLPTIRVVAYSSPAPGMGAATVPDSEAKTLHGTTANTSPMREPLMNVVSQNPWPESGNTSTLTERAGAPCSGILTETHERVGSGKVSTGGTQSGGSGGRGKPLAGGVSVIGLGDCEFEGNFSALGNEVTRSRVTTRHGLEHPCACIDCIEERQWGSSSRGQG